jgi:hypothetical protein
MDKYTAVWISHSSINDFRSCPRAYYLNNVYRDPRTGHKIALTAPALSLGSAVHEVLESLSVLPTAERFKVSLIDRFQVAWAKVSGERGGFTDTDTEAKYKARGEAMLRRAMAHPGPLSALAVKIKQDLPHYWLDEEVGIILCGKIDWLEYNQADDSVKILDFKTGKNTEKPDSLQLPIYYLLVHNCQGRTVTGAAYWYLETDDVPVTKPLPNLDTARELVLKWGKDIKLARSLNRFKCPEGEGGCKYCRPLEKIVKGEATFVGTDAYDRDVYSLAHAASALPESEVL